MCGRWLRLVVLVGLLALAAGKGKRHRNNKPGRALFDRLSSTTLTEVSVDDTSGVSGVLLPAPLDVAPYSIISANATCGDEGTEEYCRETPGKRGVVCEVCEGPDGSPSRRHPPAHAMDSDPGTWWQSPSLGVGDYHHVELVIRLPDKMELLHVIIKSGPSPRPLAWSLEVSPSRSGEEWRMIRAFGDRDHCRKLWDLRPERRRRKARGVKRTNRADQPTCSIQFASPRPLENGEMHIAIGEGVNARRVRISFRAAHASSPRQQYYTVREITLAARCLCHGHATTCNVDADGAHCSCPQGSCAHCTTDHTGAQLCVNCTDNRAGPLCDKCLLGYFSTDSDGPCEPCNCDPEGSDGTCDWDKKHHQVSCNCLPGFSGPLCDLCDSEAVYPNCQQPSEPSCKCDPRGVVDPEKICDEHCECKSNVVGERCDTCAQGHFGLSASLSSGCRPCYCSHVTESCTLDTAYQPTDIIIPLEEGWLVTDSQFNETVEPSLDDQGHPFIISYEVEGWEHFYWLTSSFNGEQFDAYGGELQVSMFWGIVRGDTGGNPTFGPDIILVGADGTKIACTNNSHETPGQLNISVSVMEGNWWTLGEEPELISRIQLMDVLSDVRGMMIRAHYHFDQDEVRLQDVRVRGAIGDGLSEVCACPPARAGPHCQRCAWGHARAGNSCLPCACNMHAHCETVDGPCGPCQHNTTGPNCERCLPGHYGNPVQGACKPCACPLFEASNNFSPNCVLASAEGDEYVCTQCPEGYSGDHCESCDFGYWGSPGTPGGSCRPCACGGSPCHPTTGECRTCPDNTEGAKCDLCKEGYYRSGDVCEVCACGAGALSAACDLSTGACACRTGWTGRDCSTCAPGHGGISEGCPACECGAGAVSAQCEAVSGACACAAGAAPPRCDTCLQHYYGLTADGCTSCNCSTIGSESNVCDIRTGQCRCRLHVTGRACDTCEEGYWGLERGGCKKCECGAGAAACDPVSGACACAPGVGGAQCDTCLPGYYGFGPTGCLPCPICTDGKVCSPVTGRCVCPLGSRGAGCAQCARGYRPLRGRCRPCACGHGALSNVCDSHTGQCQCRTGWSGLDCDACAPGHYGPRCKPCRCVEAGTRNCTNGTCTCDQWGRCPCKENVVGEKCNECLEGTFGLSADNPEGCTACFCFGRVSRCSQAQLARAALHAHSPTHLTLIKADKQHAITNVDQDSLLAIHTQSREATISLPWPPSPVYMELGERFLGDRVTSYGGYLRFTIEEEGGSPLPRETLAKFPLVRLYGRNIVLDYYEPMPAANNGTYAVRLHESLWTVRGTRARSRASRGALLVALHRLDRLLLRASTRAPAALDRVHVLLLNVSLDTALPGLSRSAPALGVEVCECPRGYAATSCQEPAVGFWMPPTDVRLTAVHGTILIHVEGDARPCNCNGRAASCDPHTGDCLNCTAGTGGPRCAECAAGWYGSPSTGCMPCACPDRLNNRAAACAPGPGGLRCLCQPGYSGSSCEQCAAGYYPRGGECVRCGCEPLGAVSERCDARGRCTCRPHATGDKCDRCVARRTYLDDTGCSPCDDCTRTLLDSVEALSSEVRSRADPTELSRIPKPFPALREFSRNATALHQRLKKAETDRDNSRSLDRDVAKLEEKKHEIITEINRLKTEASRRKEEAGYLSLESMSALEEVLKERRKIGERVAELDDFARGERHLSAHRALKEARRLLHHIKDISLSNYYASANDVFDLANVQSTAVQEYNYRIDHINRRLQQLLSSLETWELKSAELPLLAQEVWRADDTVMALKEKITPRLAAVRDIGLRCRLVIEDIETLSSHNLTDAVGSSILRAQTLSIRFPALAAELEVLTLAAEEKEGILYNLTPSYKEKYLEAVQRHVEDLGAKAEEYKMLFAGTRSAAARGVAAAGAWRRVAEDVRAADSRAEQAARAARAAAALAQGPRPLAHTAQRGHRAAQQLAARAATLLEKAEELRGRLAGVSRGASLVAVWLRGVGWAARALEGGARAHVAHTLAQADASARRVLDNTRAIYDEASEIRGKIRYNLRQQLAELQKHGDTALGAAEEHVSQIRSDTRACAATVSALEAAARARRHQHDAATTTHAPARSALAHKLQLAKHIADTISVSVRSVSDAMGGGCARAYSVWGGGGSITRLGLAVTFENQLTDGGLLYLLDDTLEKERYMWLYVENKRLHLRWELGAGEGLIDHPEVLQPTHDDGDHTTYKIEIERVWNTVNLKVGRAGTNAVVASNSSSSSGVRLVATALWLGAPPPRDGSPPAHTVPPALTGCVHALYSDDITLGLWKFHHQPKEAKCTGCTQRWVGGEAGGGGGAALAWFGGRGYAALRRSHSRPPDRRQLSIAFTFRTRDENALLFAAIDQENNRSVSVMLVSCRVEFVVEYGGARLRISDNGPHCDNTPRHVQAIRLFHRNVERGSLRVNGAETLGSPVPAVVSAAALPALGGEYWVGGAPPGAPAPGPPLLGCLGALSVDREGYDLLSAPRRYGLEPHCGGRILRTALLEGNGYIELPSPGIRRKASLGISFLSHAADGLLLYRSPAENDQLDDDGDDKHYLLLALVKGQLELIMAAGKAEVRLRTNGTRLDDKRMHSVRVVRLHKQVEVWVDEELSCSGVLPGGALAPRGGGLYAGGAGPAAPSAAARGLPAAPFTGILADIIVDSQIIGMETSIRWKSAGIGRGGGEGSPARRAPPKKHHDNKDDAGCTKSPSYTVEGGAVKFGDAAWSHVTMRTRRSRKLTLSVQIRTYAADGLILLIPGSKNKPKHYCALTSRDGRLHLVVRGRKRKEITLNGHINDGKWRTVTISLSRSRVELTSEGEVSTARSPPFARAQRLYVGGIPPPPTLANVPNSIVRVGSFRGCMRRVSINGRAEDLVRDAHAHHRVGQCFPNIEQGAYFGGDAYATWSSSSSVGESGELNMTIRTTERNGVLFTAPGLLLEINNGAVVLSRSSEGTIVSSVRLCCACGGAWTRVGGGWRGAALWVRVGGAPPLAAHAPLLDPPPPHTGRMYIGGLPEGTIDTNETSGKANFKGCIRDVTISGVTKDWTEMEDLHNVLLDSCPIQP